MQGQGHHHHSRGNGNLIGFAELLSESGFIEFENLPASSQLVVVLPGQHITHNT
jgi:hypothetical protein